MTVKFNAKTFRGKKRIYNAVPRAPRISRLWVWDDVAQEYRAPEQGKIYCAGRYEKNGQGGKKKRVYEFFASLDEARNWQDGEQEEILVAQVASTEIALGPLFRDIVDEWRRRRFPQLGYGTQVQYEKILTLHFGSLMDQPIHEITPQRIDRWLDDMKAACRMVTRASFDHELTLLSNIIRYYLNYHDDTQFQFPIKQRHRDAIRLNRTIVKAPKDLSEEEFLRFREQLLKAKRGEMWAVLATVQYYQALRISEAAGVYWEDVILDRTIPQNSRIKIVRSVCYPHKTGLKAFVKGGFKNAKSNGGMKEQPMFPQTFAALAKLYVNGASQLVFHVDGEPLSYRSIQTQYDSAFKKCGLPYRGTHVMRHGGCRRVFNEVAELPIAQQLLGNSDMKTTLIYAKRHAGALTKVAHGYWDKSNSLLANACTEKNENDK